MLLCRCEKLPEEYQRDFYDYYAIDIGNEPKVIQYFTNVRSSLRKYEIDNVSTCEFLDTTITIAEFPPCDPNILKLRPMCTTQCQTFATVISRCFGDAVELGITISEFAAVYDTYNCTDPNTHLPGVSGDLYGSQGQCYNVSYLTQGRCNAIYF